MMFRLLALLAAAAVVSADLVYHSVAPAGWNYDLSSTDACAGTHESPCGPHYWSKVSVPPKDNKCGESHQSPINLGPGAVVENDLEFPVLTTRGVGCTSWAQFADDHAFEVSFSETGHVCADNTLTYGGKTYQLLQFHFHSPSEHTVGDGFFDAEYHMVHKEVGGTALLVLGVLVRAGADIDGADNLFTKNFFGAVGSDSPAAVAAEYEIESDTPIRPYEDFLPASKNFYTYPGSLTTYPCTEGVTWIVFEEPISASAKDIKTLRDAVAAFPGTITIDGNDNRPVQPLNDRLVQKYVDHDTIGCSEGEYSETGNAPCTSCPDGTSSTPGATFCTYCHGFGCNDVTTVLKSQLLSLSNAVTTLNHNGMALADTVELVTTKVKSKTTQLSKDISSLEKSVKAKTSKNTKEISDLEKKVKKLQKLLASKK